MTFTENIIIAVGSILSLIALAGFATYLERYVGNKDKK